MPRPPRGRRAYQLTDEGRSYVEAHPEEVRAPWDVVAGSVGDSAIEMRNLIGQVAMAAFQVVSAGTEAQVGQAREVLTDTRKALYRLLAADDGDDARRRHRPVTERARPRPARLRSR